MDNTLIKITDLYFKPRIEFFNIEVLDKVFTGIKRSPNVYVIKSDAKIDGMTTIEFEWEGIKYQLFDIHEHYTRHLDWRIIECVRWAESKI